MADPVLVGLYIFASVSQAVLMLFSVYLGYRIVRTIGTFWAWSLIGVAFMLFALRDVASVVSLLQTSAAQLTTNTGQFTATSYWPETIVNQGAYTTLTAGMYGLYKIFTKKSVHANYE